MTLGHCEVPNHLLLPDEELGWMDDGTDDGTDGWKGRPPKDII